MVRFISAASVLAIALLTGAEAAQSAGCGKALDSSLKQGETGKSNRFNLTSNGIQRSYLLHFPLQYTPINDHGLIFSFHGRSNTGSMQESLSKLSVHDVNPNMLVAYPDGIDQQWQGDPDATTDDVKFTLDMIKKISSQFCIDSNRIFATGMSNGGGFSGNILACDPIASTKIAAFAPVSGAYYQGNSDAHCNGGDVPISCNPGRKPIPIHEIHGLADGTIPYNGGGRRGRCLPNMPHFITEWSKRNGLGETNSSTNIYGGKVTRYTFGKAAGLEGINTHLKVQNLGHTWPSSSNSYFNATPVIMDFFKKWDLSTAPIQSSGGSSSSTSSTLATSTSSTSKSTTKSTTKTSSTDSSASSLPTVAVSPSCPSANGTMFTDSTSGDKYSIFCGYDSSASAFASKSSLGSFGACIRLCSDTTNCEHVVYNGVCYFKKSMKGLRGGKPQYFRVAVHE